MINIFLSVQVTASHSVEFVRSTALVITSLISLRPEKVQEGFAAQQLDTMGRTQLHGFVPVPGAWPEEPLAANYPVLGERGESQSLHLFQI